MPTLRDTFAVLNTMRDEGVVEDYAIAGAMAILFWTEPVPTFDLHVLVFLPGSGVGLVSLDRSIAGRKRTATPPRTSTS